MSSSAPAPAPAPAMLMFFGALLLLMHTELATAFAFAFVSPSPTRINLPHDIPVQKFGYVKNGAASSLAYSNHDDDTDNDGSLCSSTTNTILPPSLFRLLDVNGDGKIDGNDFIALRHNMKDMMDMNGDGEVNEKDVAAAVSIGVLSWACCAAPAQAKGGSHGGGGHSSSHSSRSTSGGYHASSSNKDDDYEEFKRPNSKDAFSKRFELEKCSNLPAEGELVDVLTDATLHRGIYSPATVIATDESLCKFVVSIDAGKGGDIETEAATLQSFQTVKNWRILLPYGLALGKIGVDVFDGDSFEWDLEFATNLLLHPKRDGAPPSLAPPSSGYYSGYTKESDGSSQLVSCNLQFEDSGLIIGSGKDSIDGKYTIDGMWHFNRFRWVEKYKEGFSVIIRGEYDKKTGRMNCSFRSSRGVRGKAFLSKTVRGPFSGE